MALISLSHLHSSIEKSLVEVLSKNFTITFLDLSNAQINNEVKRVFQCTLQNNIYLDKSYSKNINHSSNGFGSESGRALVDAIYKNTTLTFFLNISDNQLEHGVRVFQKLLAKAQL
ncbi:hypothetical protein C2G38_2229740 [Gigaspora rosea]|uniref:Uncharacterized protein n=1 Tax=Gigaspora rosea TaxID=44941 RepID=A0A397TUH2_9GLOM|nr:hypothetical protein C2G38_2229740 [Gigaspora rosea]